MSLLTALAVGSRVASGLGLFDFLASRIAGRLPGGDRARKAEPALADRPSTTLIVSRLEFIAGLAWAVWLEIEPAVTRLEAGDDLSIAAWVLVVSGAVKAVQRYRTTHAVGA